MPLTNLLGFIPMAIDPGVRLDAAGAPGFSVSFTTLDASAEKAAFIGSVWHPTVKTGTISIRKVHFGLSAVTFDAASVLRVSLQNVSATAGPPYQPDGTQDQTADLTSLTANAMNATGNLSADRTVNLANDSLGDADSRWLAVVFEYGAGGFTTGDSIVLRTANASTPCAQLGGSALQNLAGTWALTATPPVIVLECADGTFAFLQGATPFSAFGSASVASNGAIRRAGVKFKVPVEVKIDRMSLFGLFPNVCDGTLELYDSDGTTVLRSIDVDNDAVGAAGTQRFAEVCFEPVTLAADTFYRFVFTASTTTAATIYYGDVAAAGHMDGLILGQNAHWTQHDGASWSDTTTRRPHFGIGVSAIHDGAGGGGSGGVRLAGHGGFAA